MGKRGYHATGEKEELVCKVWEKKPQAGSNEEKCRDSASPSLHLQFQYGCKDSGKQCWESKLLALSFDHFASILVVFHCILGSGLMDRPPRGTRSSKHRVVDRGQALALLLQRETLGMAILHCCLSLLLPPTSW